MKHNPASQSGIFTPRVGLALALCSVGIFLAMLSFAATPPVETTHTNTALQAGPRNFPSTFGGSASGLPPGVPLPPGAQFFPNGQGESPTSLGPAGSESRSSASAQSIWSIVSSPNTSATQGNYLRAVTCVSASDCWAVGWHNTNVTVTLIQHWNGTAWSIVSSPNPPSSEASILSSVTCASASECWAVGWFIDPNSVQRTLIERWNGTTWAIVPSPDAPTPPGHDMLVSVLSSVTCTSATDCWAVGHGAVANSVDYGRYQTLIEHWDGTSWSVAVSPNVSSTQNNLLFGVTCVSASDCWAVGEFFSTSSSTIDMLAGSAYQTLAVHWNGAAWSIVSTPNHYPNPTSCTVENQLTCREQTCCFQPNSLFNVTCTSAFDCWAVGQFWNGRFAEGGIATLIQHWNGAVWSIVPSPSSSERPYDFLNSVTCVSASDCWAIGEGSGQTLTEHWDGTAWSIVPSPNTSAEHYNVLSAVTCVSASDCWAVGDYYTNDPHQTLIAHYTPAPPTPTSVVSRKTHGTAGNFDVDLPLIGSAGIECRTGGVNNAHQVIVTFPAAVTFTNATVTSGTGTVSSSSGSGTTAVTVNLTGVTNAQTIKLTLFGVNDGAGPGNLVIPMSVLAGDTTANKVVSNTDVASVKSQISSSLTASNFRADVNANGSVSNTDVSVTKAQVSTSLP